MKVLHVVKFYHPSKGGIESYVRQLCRGLVARNVEVSAIAFNHKALVSTQQEEIEGVRLRRVRTDFFFKSQPFGTEFKQQLQACLAEVDVVHLHSPFPYGEYFVPRLTQKPIVITWCAEPAATRWRYIMPLYRCILGKVLTQAKAIVANGPNSIENSPSLKKVQSKGLVIPLAARSFLGTGGQEPRKRINNKPHLTALFVGRLRKYKSLETLLSALKAIPQLNLQIVGEGEERANLEAVVGLNGLSQRVNFLGEVSDFELANCYQRADMFVLPSINASESFGLVQAEAMMFGLPVINTYLPSSVPWVSQNEQTGITVPPGDAGACARALQRLITDGDFYEKCSRNALVRAKDFEEEKMVSSYLELYKGTIF